MPFVGTSSKLNVPREKCVTVPPELRASVVGRSGALILKASRNNFEPRSSSIAMGSLLARKPPITSRRPSSAPRWPGS